MTLITEEFFLISQESETISNDKKKEFSCCNSKFPSKRNNG